MKRFFVYTAFLGALLTANSCTDKLNLNPSTQIVTSKAVTDASGVKAAITGMYSGMFGTSYYGRSYLVMSELTADNVYLSAKNSNRYLSTYRLLWLTTDTDVNGIWSTGYNIILRANNVINNADNVKDFVGDDKNLYLGQAYFIRALVHFDLVRFFAEPYNQGNGAQAGIPYMTKFEVGTPKRNTVGEVYTNLIADLKQAQTLLANADVTDPFHANADAATALLARVYLYMGDNANAATTAGAVINSGNYSLFDATANPSGYADFFNTPGTSEDIFTIHIMPTQTVGSDNFGNMFFKPGYGDIRVSPDLVSTFETGDARRNFISAFSGSPSEYQNNKFTGQDGIAGLYSPKVLRLSEMYLIRAEANAKQSKFVEALADLTALRAKRGLGALSIPNSGVLAAIDAENRKEFAFEGHRYFDKLRNGSDITRNYCGQSTQVSGAPCTIPAISTTAIFPIPQAEINVNPNMDQNPGYKQ